jgi:hypothetical protein
VDDDGIETQWTQDRHPSGCHGHAERPDTLLRVSALPTLSDVLALPVVRRGAPEVVAGADLLDRPVRWAHVAEIADR